MYKLFIFSIFLIASSSFAQNSPIHVLKCNNSEEKVTIKYLFNSDGKTVSKASIQYDQASSVGDGSKDSSMRFRILDEATVKDSALLTTVEGTYLEDRGMGQDHKTISLVATIHKDSTSEASSVVENAKYYDEAKGFVKKVYGEHDRLRCTPSEEQSKNY